MPKRRTTILGLGALAMGSGAAFTSAAFQSSVAPGADFQVIVADELVARGLDEGDEDDDATVGGDVDFVDNDHLDFSEIDTNELPRATVDEWDPDTPGENINDQLTIKLASNFSDHSTDGLFAIENNGDLSHDVGIAFRDPTEEGSGDDFAYGGDVDTTDYDGTTGDLSREQVQEIYQFKEQGGDLISPDPNGGDDGDHTFDNPGGKVTLTPGDKVYVDLEVDTTTHQSDIIDAADIGDDPFGGDRGQADLLDTIWVGTDPDVESS